MKWRKWNQAIHRDLGYFFFGMTIIYALSGIALNHAKQWNPNYDITTEVFRLENPPARDSLTKEVAIEILKRFDAADGYKKYYFPDPRSLKIFFQNGSVVINLTTGEGVYEKLTRRFIFYHVNFLHYNPQKWWTWFADIYAVGLLLLAITGLFILKGKNGITGRGAWLTAIGVLIPVAFLIWFS